MIDRFLEKIIRTPLHSSLWKVHRKLFPFPQGWFDAKGQTATDLIRKTLTKEAPCLIGKLGTIELEAIMAYLYKDRFMWPWKRAFRYISGDVRYKGWKPELRHKLSNNAGFFSNTDPYLSRFAELYVDILPEIDILHSWLHAETLLVDRMPDTLRCTGALAPWVSDTPWTKALAGKRILVIHPFEASIQQQYPKRHVLFKNQDLLPEFHLITLKAINSAAGEKVPFKNWFDALDSMKNQINQIDFDIALIGAGAYSLPLGAHIKSTGKKAVHLGGNLQVLFGIYGERHLTHPLIKALINGHWIRPLDSDKISNYKKIENGCYW